MDDTLSTIGATCAIRTPSFRVAYSFRKVKSFAAYLSRAFARHHPPTRPRQQQRSPTTGRGVRR
jgi:hypothetical protein